MPDERHEFLTEDQRQMPHVESPRESQGKGVRHARSQQYRDKFPLGEYCKRCKKAHHGPCQLICEHCGEPYDEEHIHDNCNPETCAVCGHFGPLVDGECPDCRH